MERHQGYFVARKDHPLAGKGFVDPQETFAFPFVALSRYPPRALQPMLTARKPASALEPGRPFPAVEAPSLATIKGILRGSDAIAPLTLPMIADEMERGSLAVLGTAPWAYSHYGIVKLKGHAPSAACSRFIRCLQQAEAALVLEEARLVLKHVHGARADGARQGAG
jgi:DNA-binding transcriptional LysR family regulator